MSRWRLKRDDGTGTNLEDFIGLAKSRPLLALMMAVFMLSLTGIPLTAGFIGKWFVFQAALDSGLTVLAIIGVLTSVVSAFYYVRIIVNMYLATVRAIRRKAQQNTSTGRSTSPSPGRC